MQQAFEDLIAQGVFNGSEFNIETTHHYVKFFPQNDEEYDLLTSDSTLILYDYPLDYEIVKMGDYYHSLSA